MKAWLHSLVAAAIGGAVSAVGDILVNLSAIPHDKSGWMHLIQVAAIGALVAVGALLKQSPLKSSNTN